MPFDIELRRQVAERVRREVRQGQAAGAIWLELYRLERDTVAEQEFAHTSVNRETVKKDLPSGRQYILGGFSGLPDALIAFFGRLRAEIRSRKGVD